MVPHSSKCDSPLLGAQCDSEEQADVVFVVCGAGGERWRVPAHRRVLAAASPVFHAMLQGPLAEAPGREVCVRDVERRPFDLLLRHMYGKAVELQSVDTALGTLYAAHKYQREELESQCLDYLSSHINTSSVLVILQHIRFYCNSLGAHTVAAPSAPSLDVIESREETENECLLFENSARNNCNSILCEPTSSKTDKSKVDSTLCELKVPLQCVENHSKISVCDNSQNYTLLLQRCLQFIDLKADKVLQQELIDELSKEELLFIVQRDTLCLSSEVVLFKALEHWSKSVCKRNCLELSSTNRRNALGDELLFSVRYLLMTSEEFMNNPMKSELLKKEECTYLLGHILKHSEINKLGHLEKLLPNLRKERQKHTMEYITSRFCSSDYKESISINKPGETSQVNLKPKKLFKKKKDQCKKEDVRLQERKPHMSDYFFSCIACIFD
ncbi:hypothetical protein R5R35_005808 [Gryllus longicercus]